MPSSHATAADQISYADLYARWEQGNWRATEIDFTRDREDWANQFTDLDRRSALWTYTLFFHGEDSVADNLSPFIDAAPLEEQKYFLATQQVDEARHAVLFARFLKEVAGASADVGSSLEETRASLTWGFRKVFDRLDRMTAELRRDHSKPKLAQAITLYHLVIEASLAQPGQHFIEEGLARRELLPGFRSGIANVARDEQRHIAFGVKMIADLVREDSECEPAIADLLREVLPFTTAVFVPPGWDERYVTAFGSTLEEVFAQGAEAIEGRLRAAGLDPTSMRLGPNGPVTPNPEATAMLFDGLRRQIDPSVAPGAKIQWDFSDAEPWHLRIDNGASAVAQGRVEDADLTFHCRLADWVELAAGRTEPWRALLTGKVRPSGSLRMLMRAPKLFG